jgi:hypothetical protein
MQLDIRRRIVFNREPKILANVAFSGKQPKSKVDYRRVFQKPEL